MKRIPPYVDILLMLVLATAATLPHYFGTDIPGGTDVRNAFYPWWTFAHNQLMQGRFPLWEPYQFLGGPFVANAQSALFSPVTWPTLLLGPRWGLAIHSTLLLWIGAAGMMVWVWQMRDEELSTNRRIGAFFAGVAFVFSPYVAVRWWTGHITLLTTVMWTPWLLAATLWSLRQPRRWAAYAVSSIPLALILVSGHPPSAFYATLPWVVWLVHLALLRNDWRRPLEQFLLAGVVGSMTAAVQLLPVVEILPYAWSSGQVVTDGFYAFSVRPLYILAALTPAVYSLGLDIVDEMVFSSNVLALFGWLLAVVRCKSHGRYLLVTAAVGALLAMGSYTGVYPFLYENVPYFSAIRLPSRAVFLLLLCIAAGLGEGIANLEDTQPRHLNAALGITAAIGLAGLAGLLDYAPTLEMQAIRSVLSGLISAVLLAVLLRIAFAFWERFGWGAAAAVGALLFITAGAGSVPLLQKSFPADTSPLFEELAGQPPRIATLDDTDLYNAPLLHPIVNTGGYNPLQIEAYRDLHTIDEGWQPEHAFVLPLFGVDYLLTREPGSPWEVLETQDDLRLYRVPDPLPVARVVHQIEVGVDDPRGRVLDEDFNPATTAIVSAVCPIEEAEPAAGEILVQEPGMWAIEVETDAPGVLVLAETAYPGWRVWVNGERADPLTAYGALKAVCVPAGASTVRWAYRPMSVYVGAAVSVVGCVLIAASIVRLRNDGDFSKKDEP